MVNREPGLRGLARLTRIELIDLILHDQQEIASLRPLVRRLSERVAALQRVAVENPSLDVPAGANDSSLEDITRLALRHLHDTTYLEHCALAERLAGVHGQIPQARDLQHAIYRAIDELKPGAEAPGGNHLNLHYKILVQTFIEKRGSAEVTYTLAISERQYYRLLKQAIWRVVDYLLNSSCSPLASPSFDSDRE